MLMLLVTVAAGAAALAALWIFRGREISSFIDRYWTVETKAAPIKSIAYEGSGTGGILIINGVSLSLNDVRANLSPSVGSTKDNQLALATSGKVSLSARSHPPPRIPANVSLLRRLQAIRPSLKCATAL